MVGWVGGVKGEGASKAIDMGLWVAGGRLYGRLKGVGQSGGAAIGEVEDNFPSSDSCCLRWPHGCCVFHPCNLGVVLRYRRLSG